MEVTELVVDDTATYVLDIAGILVGSLLGAQVAMRERFDITGTLVLAIACGVGGGMIRDVLISDGPPLALIEPAYLGTALLGAGIMLVVDVPGWKHGARALTIGDALLLGFFAAAGCQRASDAGLPLLAVGLLGVITAVGGGMVRDVLVGRAPAVLQGGTLYASVAIVAAACYVLVDALGAPQFVTVMTCIVVGFVLRMAALHWQLELPTDPQPLGPRRVIGRIKGSGESVGLFRRHRRQNDP